ncbi:MAG: peptidase M20, partial [Hyphomonas sp.]
LPGIEFDIEPVNVSHGYEADDTEVAPLVAGVDVAVQAVLDHPVEIAKPVYSSMWRDHNVFNMHRVPAITFGPVRWRPTPEDFFRCTLMYALTALVICGRMEGDVEKRTGRTVYGDNPFD